MRPLSRVACPKSQLPSGWFNILDSLVFCGTIGTYLVCCGSLTPLSGIEWRGDKALTILNMV